MQQMRTIRQRLVAAGISDAQVSRINRYAANTPHDPLNLLVDDPYLLITDSGTLFSQCGGKALMSFSPMHSAFNIYLVVDDNHRLSLVQEG